MILGFVTNIVLDYALVWVIGWGMTGAALATMVGQTVTLLASLIFSQFRNADGCSLHSMDCVFSGDRCCR